MPTEFHNKAVSRKHVIQGSTDGDRINVTTVPTLLHGVQAFNLSTGIAIYVHIYDSTALVSTTGVDSIKTLLIPAAVSPTTVSIGSGFIYRAPPITLSSGFTYAIGGNLQSTGAFSTVAAGLGVVNFDYEPLRNT